MIELHENLIGKVIIRPNAPNHFMRLRPQNYNTKAVFADTEIAASTNAIKLFEVGKDFYDPSPVVIFNRDLMFMQAAAFWTLRQALLFYQLPLPAISRFTIYHAAFTPSPALCFRISPVKDRRGTGVRHRRWQGLQNNEIICSMQN